MRSVPFMLMFLMLAIPLAGCKEEPQKEIHTVEWFLNPENKAVLDETLKQCKNNPGVRKDDPNCINAQEALHKRWGRRAGVPKFE